MVRTSNDDNNDQETKKEMLKVPESTVLGYFEDDQKITLEHGKKKLMDEDLLGFYSPKVIFDKLHYQRKKTNATSAVSCVPRPYHTHRFPCSKILAQDLHLPTLHFSSDDCSLLTQ